MNKEQYLENLRVLKNEYPKWNAPVVTLIAIHSNDPFKILISTILSLRTKDEVTSIASERLFEIADSADKLAKLDSEIIEKLIYPVGFYKRKAIQIKQICIEIIDNYGGNVPDNLNDLLKFKGVGRKTANLVLSLGFKIPAICVDVHVHRISNRFGFVETKTPEETEFVLMGKLPKSNWNDINDLLVAFGQTICRPVSPKCILCPLKFCKFGGKF
ncbi:MAG: endonuclease III [Candidatus Delongbacteria bacterium]|nr:endonuclease III [Candidatus Delongbacteria bacterium]MBN2836524.1 endonuclease III [Candidatus Delongbacteria bacterium]